MTSFEIQRVPFDKNAVRMRAKGDPRHRNWPVVYLLDGGRGGRPSGGLDDVYVGETLNAEACMLQHLDNDEKRQALSEIRVVLDDRYNKSVLGILLTRAMPMTARTYVLISGSLSTG